MATGEGGCGAFAGIVRIFYELIEDSVGPSGTDHSFVVGVEIVVQVGEDALCDLVFAHRLEVVLRSGDGQEDENHVIDEEGSKYDGRGAFKLFVPAKEVKARYECYHGEVAGISEVHQFAKNMVWNGF